MAASGHIDPNATREVKAPITDGHRRVAFAFMQMLRSVDIADSESVDVVIAMLSQQFDVDAAGVGGKFDTGCDLVALVGTADSRVRPEDADKFKEFIDLLSKKGYFKGADEGTAEYENRMKKAIERFNARNNPFEGLTADQLKEKGNEHMRTANYKDAVKFYTKAIELSPNNHIFYANRAAAHTHLKDYRSAIIDCEKSVAINDQYSKAYSRLGTALFYEGSYQRAVDAYSKACELDPTNEGYQADLAQAKEKLTSSQPVAGAPGGFPGFPGMGGPLGGMRGGMPDMTQMMSMMNDPNFMQMASQMMANPQFSQMVAGMAGQMGRAAPSPQEMNQFMEAMKSGQGVAPRVDEQGRVVTPFGAIKQDDLQRLRDEEMANNPKMRAIVEDVKQNGFNAFSKYMGDPEVMQLMQKFSGLVDQSAGAPPSGGPGADGGSASA